MSVSNPIDIGKNTPAAGSASGTVTFTTTTSVPSSGKILLCVAWAASAGVTLSSVSASGCTGQVVEQQISGTLHIGLATLDAPSGLASGQTVTATFSNSTPDSRYICGSYVVGALTAGEYGAVGNLGTTAIPWDSSSTTPVSGDLLYGGSFTGGTNGTSAPSGGNTEIHDFAIAGDSAMTDVYQSGTGASVSAQGTWTVSGTRAWTAAAIIIAKGGATPTATHSWQGTGPWYQDFLIPVSAVSNTISMLVKRDGAYSPSPGGTLPAMLILANPTLGVTAQTIVDAQPASQWNTLQAAAFTPTGTGWVTVRILSQDGSGLSVVKFTQLTDG